MFKYFANVRNYALNLGLSFLAIVLTLAFLEFALRVREAAFDTSVRPVEEGESPPLHIVSDKPFIYGLNPEHDEISSQGLRNPEVVVPKPADESRILVIGDSVTYGIDVEQTETFSSKLAEFLSGRSTTINPINAGVSGYTAYNELQYYLHEGRKLKPDLVILAFCMNDVANPRLHWGYTSEAIIDIPERAIPNLEYDLTHAMPIFDSWNSRSVLERAQQLLRYSSLYNAIEWRIAPFLSNDDEQGVIDIEAETPTYITGEDTISLSVYLDELSPEWLWITSIYDEFLTAVREDDADFLIVFFPLAYQMDEGYPYFPQANLSSYCESRSIRCIDLLPSFKKHPKESLFFLDRHKPVYDVWHLTEFGHEYTAQVISEYIEQMQLLP